MQATLIRLTRLTDTSLIAHWLTLDCGLIKTVAKGARRPKSPFAGKLDLFFSGEITFSRARRGELHPLKEVVIHHWREGLRKSYASTLLAAYCCQLLELAMEPDHPEPELHDLLDRALGHLEAAPPTMRALLHFENELVRILGVAHHQTSADRSLRETLGRLPGSRTELIDRLTPAADFRSSNGDLNS
ncbi:recombination protein O N-terminal domain-containing protein [Luteolibacter pohnpeiensis]|uniref:DNA repair protein RecO n=1 Tax=Luteolibacter pohnpeiensis TaxID=454153 RepID=A0A934SBQ2_9BACT|nr:recombination protein O N-terminal domain-containing protein [Luteolibacter pohnpeiensis]MBK1882363.1 recombination protein O N-terminal domain-containing protein [Luteolibacter pohnpeiensis]